ncbi:MAG: hypothetical protein U1F29_05295 [Planctomycetota bacterium]
MTKREDFESLSIPLQRSEHAGLREAAAYDDMARRIVEGIESGPAESFAPDFFERLRERVRAAQRNSARAE